jgi:glycine cleavage system aminomethyltransferase T
MGGLELHGPAEDRDIILAALQEAGKKFDLVMGGSRAYSTVSPESGWIPSPFPAIYSGEAMKPYREWLSASGFEANASLGGSFYSDKIEDYYQTPWDLGYGKHINFDHDFIGKEALQKMVEKPHRRKLWLKWNDDDVQEVFKSQLGHGDRYKYMEVPNAYYAILPFDKVLIGDRMVGLSTYTVYTANVRCWFSLAMIDEDVADGDRGRIDEIGFFRAADAEAGKLEDVGRDDAGHFRGFPTCEDAVAGFEVIRHAADHAGNLVLVQSGDADVVEKHQWITTGGDDVVHGHCD